MGKWVELLVQYHELRNSSPPTTSDIPPAKKVKNEPISSSLTSFGAASSTSSSTSTASTSSQLYSPTSPYLSAPTQTYPSAYPARQVPPHMSKPSYQAQASDLSSFSALLQSLTNSQSLSGQAVTAKQPQRARPMTVDGKSSVGQAPVVRPNPLAPATPNAPFLPMFNQTAAQRGVKVDYSAEFSGPSHAGQWTVQCIGTCFD